MRANFHILVVDDDTAFRQSLCKALIGVGLSVHTASNGREALALLEKQQVHLVFSDMKMPEMTGLELLKRIRQLYPDMPVVLVTAFHNITRGVDAFDAMASGYLSKPVKRHEILEVLKTFLDLDVTNSTKP
jgi:CheY-like chemotaxis protein